MQGRINIKYSYSNKLCSIPQNKHKLKVTCDQAISLPIYLSHCFYFYYFRRWYEIIIIWFFTLTTYLIFGPIWKMPPSKRII